MKSVAEYRKNVESLAKEYLKGEEISVEVVRQIVDSHSDEYVRCLRDPLNPTRFTREQQLAYVQNHLPKSCWANRQIFSQSWELIKFLKQSRSMLKVASFGCGPGSECLAFLDLLRELERPDKTGDAKMKVEFYLFDSLDWGSEVKYFLSSANVRVNFEQVELLDPTFLRGMSEREELCSCDVILFSKFACGIFYHPSKFDFYRNLFKASKLGCYIVAVDKGSRGSSKRQEFITSLEDPAYHAGFRVVNSSNNKETGDDYVEELYVGNSQREKNLFAYRVMRKDFETTEMSFSPTCNTQPIADGNRPVKKFFDLPWM